MDIMDEKTSNRNSAIYTKASDLQQLEEELEILRQKRKSRRCSQKPLAMSENPTIENVFTKADEIPKDSPSPETPLPSPKRDDAADIKKNVTSPQQLITLDQQDIQPPKVKTRANQTDVSPKTTLEPSQTIATKVPIKPKRHENRPVPIITNPDKNESKIDQQKDSQEPHSILLKKLQLSTDKRDSHKMNRLKSSKAKATMYVTDSNTRDLTEELLLTAFNNLNSQSTPISQSTPTKRRIDSTPASDLHKKFPTPKPAFSTRPTTSQKVPSWKKQSSLKKLQSAKGKVSTAISALENGKPTTSYRVNKPNKLPRPLAEYELPSPYHQQTFNIGRSLSTEVAIKPQWSHSNLDSSQPQPQTQVQQQQTCRQNIDADSRTIQRTPHDGDLNSSSLGSTTPQPKEHSSCGEQRNDERRQHGSTQTGATDGIQRPLQSYTPQLSPLAGKCDHNLTSLLPSPKQPTAVTISTLPSPQSSPPALTIDVRKAYSLPPTPPSKHCDRSMSKAQCPSQPPPPTPHQWHIHQQNIKRPSLHRSPNNVNSCQRQLRVINVDNEDLGPTTRKMMHLEGTVQAQRDQRRYNELVGSADDSSDDSSLSDENAMDANHQYYDMNKTLPATMMMMMMKPTQPRKRYSSDNSSTLSYRHHPHHHYEQYTGLTKHVGNDSTSKGRPERRKKVSFSSVVTTIPTQTQPTSSTVNLDDYPENTRGFWEAFSAEMGHHQHQQTLLEQLDAMKSHNSNNNNKVSHSKNNPLPPLPPTLPFSDNNSSSSKLINKLWNKSRTDQSKKSSSSSPAWWKTNNNDHMKKLDSTAGDRSVSHSPHLNHPTKHRPKKPSSFRKASSSTNRTVVPEPQWRQRVPVPSRHHHHQPQLVS
ncbi:hypothetical protein BCR42DRAFT_419849 [Absidia repens]|uniref:Uncharacterized protein n=1 Tax=Absidia repens TaxID=90262 RepID=A0A1X2IAD2_9FUNG|nr:hypothetical protein BCR42DRAFT_419849 [Absidia repens]